ncbi:MAG: hypothetical protein ABJN36_05250 [Cyclobacteriaceae bacterium]
MNPTSFEYRETETAPIKTAHIDEIRTFQVGKSHKYTKYVVDLDRSVTAPVGALDASSQPQFSKEILFLRVLLEGPATLFKYATEDFEKYFISLNESMIVPLIYKKYATAGTTSSAAPIVMENKAFQNQLHQYLPCNCITYFETLNMRYHIADLSSYVKRYNKCIGSNSTAYKTNVNKEYSTFRIKAGPNYSWFWAKTEKTARTAGAKLDFDGALNLRFGCEFEFKLPIEKAHVGFVIDPSFHVYKGKSEYQTGNPTQPTRPVKLKYQSLEIPLGFRYWHEIDQNISFFANAFMVFDRAFDLTMKISTAPTVYAGDHISFNTAWGVGAQYKYKFGLEVRYQPHRNPMSDYSTWTSDYNSIALLLSYRVN